MLDLAAHIIETKKGHFTPADYTDRYEALLADLVRAKLAGKKPRLARRPAAGGVVSLLDALRESAGTPESGTPSPHRDQNSPRPSRTRRRAG
ncbi:Ku family protein [Komagataeibacter saccharivorans]|uniref:hypothetical protein n=1 Tax=Komagataeibacter saccharivorans TaxID=265959 RepID=UPI002232676B|nr:hypothetical protein [Komagataeibacter saccharivorans]